MKRLGVKLKVFIVINISVLLIATAFCVYLHCLSKKVNKNEISGEAYLDSQAYLIDNANYLANAYDNYTYFRIGSNASGTVTAQTGFEALVLFLSNASYNETYFSGKTIYMQGNVTATSTSVLIQRFDGTFDGQGHTIFFDDTLKTSGSGDVGTYIGTNNGTIKNLKISGVDVFVSYAFLQGASRVSAFVNVNNGTIDGCIVDNCTFKSDRAKTNCTVTTFCVTNNGTISNCMTTGTVALELQGSDKGIKSCYFVITGNEATNSIYAASCTEDSGYDSDKCDTPSENGDTALDSGKGNFSSCANAHSNMSSSYLSNTAGKSGTIFYKYTTTEYGYGKDSKYCVYLRAFISWTSYTFASADTSQGTVNSSSLTVPSYYASVTKSGNKLKIYSSTITATPESGYYFSSWTNDGNSYTASFTKSYYYITFPTISYTDLDGNTQTVAPQCDTFVDGTTINMNYGNSADLSCIHEADKTVIQYVINVHTVTYTLPKTHTIDADYYAAKNSGYGYIQYGDGFSDDDTDGFIALASNSFVVPTAALALIPLESFTIFNLPLNYDNLTINSRYTLKGIQVKVKTYNTVFG